MDKLTPLSLRDRQRAVRTSLPRDLDAVNYLNSDPSYPGPRPARQPVEPSMLLEYFRTLSRWRLLIVACAVLGTVVSFSLNLSVLPVYESRTSLDIQNINRDFLNMHDVAPTGDGSASSSDTYVQTQIKLLQSTTLLERTVDHLKSEPHPAAVDRDDLISQTKRGLHLSRGGDLPYNELVDDAAKRVKVKPIGITRLVEVTCDSWNAAFSARFCNTLTEQFKEADLETRGTEAQKTSEWLTQQVADIRQKAEEAQHKLEDATGGDGLALSQESNSIGEDRLKQLQGELVRAQAERMDREAQARIAASASPDSVPATLDSAAYRDYKQKLADLNAKVAELVPPLTEENPKVIHLRSQIREVEAGLAEERNVSVSRLRNEFESARHHEDLLNAAYATLQSSVSSEMSKTTRVNLLRKEVESEQTLYQTLLQRAKEAGFASAMQATTVRVVDRATPPKMAISPRRGVAAGVGMLFGSLCGFGFAFFRERNSNVFRVPGDVERHLHVHELGVIPSLAGSFGRAAILPALRGSSTEKTLDGEGNSRAISFWKEDFSIIAEAYRNTTHSILLAGIASPDSKIYVVTSPNAGEGKTTVSTNLGVALSKSKLRVVLIDGDLRKPGLHKNLMVDNSFGLRNLLRDEVDVATAPLGRLCKQTVIPNLWMVPAGSGKEEVVELLHSGSVTGLIDRLAREFDVVLIDTPPMLHMADARIFAGQADGVILVFRAGITSRDQAASACDLFEHDRVPLVGTILNDFNPAREGRTGYYESYYRYKHEIEAAEEAGVRS